MKKLFKKISKRIIMGILALLVIGVPLLYLTVLNSKTVSAAWFDDFWAYRTGLTINNSGSLVNNQKVKFDIDTATLISASKMQSDCDDSRFTDINGNLLKYYLDSSNGACNTNSTDYYVLVPTINANATIIYHYYGNPTATIGTQPSQFSEATFSPSSTSVASEEKSPGPAAYWKFDDGTGTNAQDGGSNNADGTLSGTTLPTWQTEDQCVSGKCLYYDGSTSHVSMGNPTSGVLDFGDSTDFTAAGWFKYSGTISVTSALVGKRDVAVATNAGYQIGLRASGNLFARISDGTNTVVTADDGGSKADNNWHHFAVVFNRSGNVVRYIDGVAYGAAIAESTTLTINNSIAFKVGATTSGVSETSQPFKGFIDNVNVYNYARTTDQIKADYNARGVSKGSSANFAAALNNDPAALSSGLVGYWKMNESSWNGTSNEVKDASGNSYNGTAAKVGSPAIPTTGIGKFGQAGSFTAVSNANAQYVTMGNVLNMGATDSFSISVWTKYSTQSSSANNFPRIINKGNSQTSPLAYGMQISTANDANNNKLQFAIADGTSSKSAPELAKADDDTWHHYVGIVNRVAQTISLYKDGAFQASNDISTIGSLSNSDSLVIAIRQSNTGLTSGFTGSVDEARIYNRALSSAEVTQLYNFSPGPASYWRMDENTGTTISDTAGNANTSSAFTGNTAWTIGKYGSGLLFDGTDDVVRIVESSSIDLGTTTNSYAVGAWIKTTANYSANAYVVAKDDGSGAYPYALYLNSSEYGCFQISDGTNAPSACGSTALNDGNWHYLYGVRDVANDKIYMYVDGVAITNTTDSTTATAANNDDLSVGNGGTSYTTNDFNGSIDDAKIYNYARTQKQIVEDMNGGHPAVSSPVGSAVGYWKFNEGYGTTANNSGNGGSTINGTLSGMASPAISTSGWSQSGKFGKALSFDGTNDSVSVSTTVSNIQTVAFWVKPATSTANMLALSGSAYITASSGTITATGFTTPTIYVNGISGGSLTGGAWNHVVVTTETVISGSAITFGLANSVYLNGQIDEPKIYNYALTADEIKRDYNQGSAQVLGAAGNNSSYQKQAANQEYCVPGDTTSCAAPVGRWDFEEGTGSTVNDNSGNANTGTWNGTGSHWKPGKIGTSGNFNGTDDYVNVPASSIFDFGTSEAFTIGAWVKMDGTSKSTQRFVSLYDGSTGGWSFHYNSTPQALRVFVTADNSNYCTVDGTTDIEDGDWHYITTTVNRNASCTTSDILLYVDGVKQTTTVFAATANANVNVDSSGAVTFGQYNSSNFLDGAIDQVKVFNYARSAAQVAWDYNKGAPIAHWKFDECQGATVNDSSGNANTGTITVGALGTYTSVGTCASSSASSMWYNGASGKRNYSLAFGGTDDYVGITQTSSINNLGATATFSGWYRFSTISGQKNMIDKRNAANTQVSYLVQLSPPGRTEGQIRFTAGTLAGSPYFDGDQIVILSKTSSLLTTNQWYHITVVYDGANSKIYVDGNNITESATGTYGALPNISDNNLSIGKHGSLAQNYVTGSIDEVKIYNYALTSDQVKILYTGGAFRVGPVTGSP